MRHLPQGIPDITYSFDFDSADVVLEDFDSRRYPPLSEGYHSRCLSLDPPIDTVN